MDIIGDSNITQVRRFELLLSHIGEFVQSNTERGAVLTIVLRHEAEALCKHLSAFLILFLCGIALAVLSQIASEGTVHRVKL